MAIRLSLYLVGRLHRVKVSLNDVQAGRLRCIVLCVILRIQKQKK